MKEFEYEEIIGLWVSETHFLIIRSNLIEFCVKNEQPELIEYPRVRKYLENISISDSISIYGFTNNKDEIYFEINGRIIKMDRMHG